MFEIFFMMSSHMNCMLVCHPREMRENMFLGKMLTIELKIQDVAGLQSLILNEMHKPPYIVHPGYKNMIISLRKKIFWPILKE